MSRSTRPEVTVNQPKPEVTISQAQPEVSVTQAEPNVSVQRHGEPQITVQESGRPEVTVEDRAGSDPLQTAPSQPTNQIAIMDGQQVIGRSLYGNNNSFGNVEDVVLAPDGTVELLLVDVGGFLGIGVRRVAISIDKVQLEGDRLMTSMTQEEAENLPPYDRN